MLESLSGAMLITTNSYEPEAVAATKAWYAETGRHAYLVGPLLPTASKGTAAANEKKQSAEAGEIQAFLDETLKTSGEKSLLYVSSVVHVSGKLPDDADLTRFLSGRISGPPRPLRPCGHSSMSSWSSTFPSYVFRRYLSCLIPDSLM